MSRSSVAPLIGLLLLSGACLNVEDANTNTLNFNFTQPGFATTWALGVADVPAARLAEVAADGGERALPAELSTNSPALYQSGTNVSGDLFVFHKKFYDGLRSNYTYKVSLQVGFVTNYHSGCTSGVGPAVVLKAGASSTEPLAIADAQGVLRMNIDKGAGTAAGDFTTLGDIRNGLTGCPTTGSFSLNGTTQLRQTLDLTTDATGGFWLFLGTQSSASGQRHEIYITQLLVTLHF